jgi:hypothetical protein
LAPRVFSGKDHSGFEDISSKDVFEEFAELEKKLGAGTALLLTHNFALIPVLSIRQFDNFDLGYFFWAS